MVFNLQLVIDDREDSANPQLFLRNADDPEREIEYGGLHGGQKPAPDWLLAMAQEVSRQYGQQVTRAADAIKGRLKDIAEEARTMPRGGN